MLIGGLVKSSLIDYPKKIAAVVFLQGCNFSCPYCHNPEIVLCESENIIKEEEFFDFLKTRINKLDAVVISGGEPTIHKDLYDFIKKIKNMGFLIKLDTNGTNPFILKKLIEDKLVDYIAMDIKAPFDEYENVTRRKVNIDDIKESADIINRGNTDYEFRTTVLASQLSFEDFEQIGKLINGAERYYLQKFEANTKINDECLRNEKSYKEEEFKRIILLLQRYVKIVELR